MSDVGRTASDLEGKFGSGLGPCYQAPSVIEGELKVPIKKKGRVGAKPYPQDIDNKQLGGSRPGF